MDRYQPVFNRNEPGITKKRVQDQLPVPHWLDGFDGRVPASKGRDTGPGDVFFYRNRAGRVANDTVHVLSVNDQDKSCRRLDELNRKKQRLTVAKAAYGQKTFRKKRQGRSGGVPTRHDKSIH